VDVDDFEGRGHFQGFKEAIKSSGVTRLILARYVLMP
jgi:hypothetical protein